MRIAWQLGGNLVAIRGNSWQLGDNWVAIGWQLDGSRGSNRGWHGNRVVMGWKQGGKCEHAERAGNESRTHVRVAIGWQWRGIGVVISKVGR